MSLLNDTELDKLYSIVSKANNKISGLFTDSERGFDHYKPDVGHFLTIEEYYKVLNIFKENGFKHLYATNGCIVELGEEGIELSIVQGGWYLNDVLSEMLYKKYNITTKKITGYRSDTRENANCVITFKNDNAIKFIKDNFSILGDTDIDKLLEDAKYLLDLDFANKTYKYFSILETLDRHNYKINDFTSKEIRILFKLLKKTGSYFRDNHSFYLDTRPLGKKESLIDNKMILLGKLKGIDHEEEKTKYRSFLVYHGIDNIKKMVSVLMEYIKA